MQPNVTNNLVTFQNWAIITMRYLFCWPGNFQQVLLNLEIKKQIFRIPSNMILLETKVEWLKFLTMQTQP
jgi:hypothetical protein